MNRNSLVYAHRARIEGDNKDNNNHQSQQLVTGKNTATIKNESQSKSSGFMEYVFT